MKKEHYGFIMMAVISVLTIISANILIIFGIIYKKEPMYLVGSNLLTSVLALWIRAPAFKKSKNENFGL